MPSGLKNVGQTFQGLMDRVGADLDFVFIYLDDILVASPGAETHKQHLHTILQWLRQFGLNLNLEKRELGRSSVELLGHRIKSTGVEPLLKTSLPSETTITQETCGLYSLSWGWLICTAASYWGSQNPQAAD
jgi:hypothetical protein